MAAGARRGMGRGGAIAAKGRDRSSDDRLDRNRGRLNKGPGSDRNFREGDRNKGGRVQQGGGRRTFGRSSNYGSGVRNLPDRGVGYSGRSSDGIGASVNPAAAASKSMYWSGLEMCRFQVKCFLLSVSLCIFLFVDLVTFLPINGHNFSSLSMSVF